MAPSPLTASRMLSNAWAWRMTFSVEEGYFLVNGPWAFSHWNFWTKSWTPLGLKLCFLSLMLSLILPRALRLLNYVTSIIFLLQTSLLLLLFPNHMPRLPSVSIPGIYYALFITTLSCPLQLFLQEYVSSSNFCNMSNLSEIMLELLFIWKSSHWYHLIFFFKCFVSRKSTISDIERHWHFLLRFFC